MSMATLEDLRRAAQLLPPGASLTLPRDALLAAIDSAANGSPSNGAAAAALEPDRLLAAKEVAQRLATSPRYVYAHRRSFPFTKELPGGAVRFSERGLMRWMERRT
jgi:predicted DNA-binding transcriptional regulator AlpA